MPNSLSCRIKKLAYQGVISEKDKDRIIEALAEQQHKNNKVFADFCDCCKEIYNRLNLENVKVGKNELHLCPECLKEFRKLCK